MRLRPRHRVHAPPSLADAFGRGERAEKSRGLGLHPDVIEELRRCRNRVRKRRGDDRCWHGNASADTDK